jgi:hypothetical protein
VRLLRSRCPATRASAAACRERAETIVPGCRRDQRALRYASRSARPSSRNLWLSASCERNSKFAAQAASARRRRDGRTDKEVLSPCRGLASCAAPRTTGPGLSWPCRYREIPTRLQTGPMRRRSVCCSGRRGGVRGVQTTVREPMLHGASVASRALRGFPPACVKTGGPGLSVSPASRGCERCCPWPQESPPA